MEVSFEMTGVPSTRASNPVQSTISAHSEAFEEVLAPLTLPARRGGALSGAEDSAARATAERPAGHAYQPDRPPQSVDPPAAQEKTEREPCAAEPDKRTTQAQAHEGRPRVTDDAETECVDGVPGDARTEIAACDGATRTAAEPAGEAIDGAPADQEPGANRKQAPDIGAEEITALAIIGLLSQETVSPAMQARPNLNGGQVAVEAAGEPQAVSTTAAGNLAQDGTPAPSGLTGAAARLPASNQPQNSTAKAVEADGADTQPARAPAGSQGGAVLANTVKAAPVDLAASVTEQPDTAAQTTGTAPERVRTTATSRWQGPAHRPSSALEDVVKAEPTGQGTARAVSPQAGAGHSAAAYSPGANGVAPSEGATNGAGVDSSVGRAKVVQETSQASAGAAPVEQAASQKGQPAGLQPATAAPAAIQPAHPTQAGDIDSSAARAGQAARPDVARTMERIGNVAQVIARLAEAVHRGERECRLDLQPAELGRVQARLSFADQKLTLLLSVETDQARATIQQALPELRQALEARGIALGQCAVGMGTGQGAGQGWHDQQTSHPGTPDPRNVTNLDQDRRQTAGQLLASRSQRGLVDLMV